MKHKLRFHLSFWVAFSLISVACSLSAPAREVISKLAPSTVEVSSVPSAPGNPLTVKFDIDPGSNASLVIGPEGGTLRATGADGTKFTLAVPPGALDQDAAVSMTPVKKVDALPLSGGLVGAVQLTPDGLSFSEPVTLTIETGGPASAQGYETIAFTAQGDGREFQLYPSRVEKNRITVRLAHFSGYGAGKATAEDIARQKTTHPPTGAVHQLSQETVQAAAMDVLRSQIKSAYLEMEKHLDNARTHPELSTALSEFTEWLMGVEEAGLSAEFKDYAEMAESLFVQRARQLVERLAQDCVDKRNASQLGPLRLWNRIIHRAPLSKWLDSRTLEDLAAREKKCASFGPWVTINYRFSVQAGDGYFSRGKTVYNGPLTFSPGNEQDPGTVHTFQLAAIGNEDYRDVNCKGDPECQHATFCTGSWSGAWRTKASATVVDINEDGSRVLDLYLASESVSHSNGCPHDGPTNLYPGDPPTLTIEIPPTGVPVTVEWEDDLAGPGSNQKAIIRIE